MALNKLKEKDSSLEYDLLKWGMCVRANQIRAAQQMFHGSIDFGVADKF